MCAHRTVRCSRRQTVASLKRETVPQSINRFQQLNSASISGASGMSQGEALKFLRDALAEVAPSGYHLDYSGSRASSCRSPAASPLP